MAACADAVGRLMRPGSVECSSPGGLVGCRAFHEKRGRHGWRDGSRRTCWPALARATQRGALTGRLITLAFCARARKRCRAELPVAVTKFGWDFREAVASDRSYFFLAFCLIPHLSEVLSFSSLRGNERPPEAIENPHFGGGQRFSFFLGPLPPPNTFWAGRAGAKSVTTARGLRGAGCWRGLCPGGGAEPPLSRPRRRIPQSGRSFVKSGWVAHANGHVRRGRRGRNDRALATGGSGRPLFAAGSGLG